MLFVLIPMIILIIVIKMIIDKYYEKKILNTKSTSENNSIEDYIPKSVMESVFKCPSCGASVPAKTNDHVTMFCSFCGASLKDAHTVIETARQDRTEEHKHELESKRLEEKTRQQNIELERIKLEQMAQKSMQRKQTQSFIIIAICCGIALFMCLGAAGVFK